MEQQEYWQNLAKSVTVQEVIRAYHNPAAFQAELKVELDKLAIDFPRIVELGCEYGVTSLLLTDKFKKTLIDLNPVAIELAKGAAILLNKRAEFIVADMFKLSLPEKSFDLLFNAGVVEHFNKDEQSRFLAEYVRILADDGLMVLCYPNHYSAPYRIAYLIHQFVFLGRFWPYPKEFKIFDMRKVLKKSGLTLLHRKTISKSSIFNWLNFIPPVKGLFVLLDRVFKFEGYLTVLYISKISPEKSGRIKRAVEFAKSNVVTA